jgi:2-methylisocitrate lyase-like PEP mutase family enzyme
MEKTAEEKRRTLRALLQGPGCSIAPSCNDGIQARLVEWLGFPLVHISGSGQHRALGFADSGMLTLTEMINRAREIVDAVELPIVSDGETGYGNAVNVVRTVREFERAGVAAIHIEDQMTPKRAGHPKLSLSPRSRPRSIHVGMKISSLSRAPRPRTHCKNGSIGSALVAKREPTRSG